jgi:hypothetical protein
MVHELVQDTCTDRLSWSQLLDTSNHRRGKSNDSVVDSSLTTDEI